MSANYSSGATLDAWLIQLLRLPSLWETERGSIAANPAAREVRGLSGCPNLASALDLLLQGTRSQTELLEAVTSARNGRATELAGPQPSDGAHIRILIGPRAAGLAQLVLVRDREGDATSLAVRAQATDRAASVSHELANALGAIAGWARLAQQGQRVPEALDLIEKSADSAWQSARGMLAELSGKRATSDTIDLSSFVEDAARMLEPKASARGTAVRSHVEPGVRVVGDRGAAWSIVWNLAANAVEALAHGGTVELRLFVHGDRAHLIVEDDGPGMSPEQQRRAFEPYFTTKPTGTGLGLSVVKRAVLELGGEIELRSHAGLGTRFSMSLPVAPSTSASTEPRRSPQGKRSSGVYFAEPIEGRILIVDDDASLREMIAAAVGMRGADVVAVAHPDAALAARGRFDLAIVDLCLPDMQGDALLASLRAAGIVEKGLLVTGMEPPERRSGDAEADGVLRKPFELEDLFEHIARLCPSGSRRSSATG